MEFSELTAAAEDKYSSVAADRNMLVSPGFYSDSGDSDTGYSLTDSKTALSTAIALVSDSSIQKDRILYLEGDRPVRESEPKKIYKVLNGSASGQEYPNLSYAVELLEQTQAIELVKYTWNTPYSVVYTYRFNRP